MNTESPDAIRIDDERLRYDGLDGAFIKLHIANLLLSLVTFGIYRFWARTRERRYVWGATSFLGDRFEYTGTGKELFIGFLKVALVIGLTFVLFAAAGLVAALLADTPEETQVYAQIVSLPIYALLFYLASFGAYSAMRYRMSRTVWRGIRFEQQGSPFVYANQAFVGFLICVITLGLYYPSYSMKLMRYQIGHLRFGTLAFSFDGVGSGVMRPFLWAWAICIGGLALLAGVFAGLGAAFPEFPWLIILPVFMYLFMLFIVPLAWAWFSAAVMRYASVHTFATGLGFACSATGKKLFGLWFGNLLLMVVSFSLLRPMAVNRTMRFYARHYTIAGSIDLAAIGAAPAGPKSGEGLAGYFDIDALPG